MTTIVLIFALPMLLASAMIDPAGLHLWGLISYTAIMLIVMPFAAWQSFVLVGVFSPSGESRCRSVLAFWIGASVTATAVVSFIATALSYPRPGARIDLTGHLLIPFAPRAGVAIGLFTLSMLVSCGCWGAIASILRPEVALSGALISGCVLFLAIYGLGWAMVAG